MKLQHIQQATARTAFVAVAAGVAALASAAPAWADRVVVDQYIDVTNCSQPSGQFCPQIRWVSATTHTPTVKVEYTDIGGCSDGIAHIFVDGHEWGNNVVHPGQSDGGYEIPVGPGSHSYGVRLDGVTGGCNTGRLGAWGGNLHIEELGPIPTPQPLPGI